jgi:uncharacterized tellurite resistance protein B-like protein
MGYWPSYSNIEPGCRAAYLQWLADGRHAPNACIGYVFLYFYGLERRLLVDAKRSRAAVAERAELLAEVQRLLDIYGTNGSFRSYAGALLSVLTSASSDRRYLTAPPPRKSGWDLPSELRLGLGQLAADRRAVPVAWALAWLRLHPEAWLRTPATRCPQEFDEVFGRRYGERYGEGMLIKPGNAFLARSYHPASAAIPEWRAAGGERIPDVGDLSRPLAMLREVAGEACGDLDAYSRYLGRHPDAAGTAAALALLPEGLERPWDAATQAMLAWAQDTLSSSEYSQVTAAELITRWSAACPSARSARQDAVMLALVLEKHGLGLEPDVRFGGRTVAGQAPVILFRRGAEVVSAAGDGYTAAVTVTQLGAAVAAADGRVAAAEQDVLERQVALAFSLAEDERRRLHALFLRALADPPTPVALRKRATMLPAEERQQAGELLVAVAAADGEIAPAEADLLGRLLDVLGLDVQRMLGDAGVRSSEPLARMRTAGSAARGFAIPRPAAPPEPERKAISVTLDPALIAARLAESARAASYLAEIFADDDAVADTVSPSDPPVMVVSGRTGLDPPHTALLERLSAQAAWTRSELEAFAAELGLLPDGAVEALNDAAYEVAGEPLCEGADPIDINHYALEEMLR